MTTPTAGPAAWPCGLDDQALPEDEALIAATSELHLDTAQALCHLPYAWGDRLLPSHPQFPMISRLTKDLVKAGLSIHDCDRRERTGGVCLTPSSQVGGAIVTWTTHNAFDVDAARYDQHIDLVQLMNYALADVLCALGWQTEPFGLTSAHIVTGRLRPPQQPEVRSE